MVSSLGIALPRGRPLVESRACLVAAALLAGLVLAIGSWTLAVLPVMLFVAAFVDDLPATFLLFVCFIAAVGEVETDRYLPHVWLVFYAVLLASWLYTALTRPRSIHVNVPLSLLYFGFLLVCFLSLTGSDDLSVLPAAQDWMRGPYRRVWEPLLTSTLLVLAMSGIRSERHLERVFWTIVLSGIPYAISVFFLGAEVEPGGIVDRRAGVFAAVHSAATHMLYCVIAAISLWRCGTPKKRLILAPCIVLFLATQLLTNSRTVLVALLVVALLSPLLDGGARRLLTYLAAGIVVLAVSVPLLPPAVRRSASQVVLSVFIDPRASVTGAVNTFSTRVEDVWIGLRLAAEHPMLGVGLGKQLWAADPSRPRLFHVYYITVLAETGVLGFSLFLGLVVTVLVLAFRCLGHFRRLHDDAMYFLTKGLILIVVALLIIFLTQPGPLEGGRIFWMLAGLVAAVDRLRKIQPSKRSLRFENSGA